jgi:hypothetical protein
LFSNCAICWRKSSSLFDSGDGGGGGGDHIGSSYAGVDGDGGCDVPGCDGGGRSCCEGRSSCGISYTGVDGDGGCDASGCGSDGRSGCGGRFNCDVVTICGGISVRIGKLGTNSDTGFCNSCILFAFGAVKTQKYN